MSRINGKIDAVQTVTLTAYTTWKIHDQLFYFIARYLSEQHVHMEGLTRVDQFDFDEATDKYENATVFSDETKELIRRVREHEDYNKSDYICIYG